MLLLLMVMAMAANASTSRASKQKDFAYKMYVAQAKESYNQNRNMVLSPASSYRMLHALCVASQDKTQKELRQLVSCKPRDSKKISASVRKIGKKRIRGIPQLYSSLGRLDLQTGLRILTSFASSSEILGLNLRVENRNFDLDWIGALNRINKFYNDEAERLKVQEMPNMVPDEHVVNQMSRIISSDQSIARIPIFTTEQPSERNFYTDRSHQSNSFFSQRPRVEKCQMVTMPNIAVEQVVDRLHHVTSVRFQLSIRDLSMILLIPDDMNLAAFENDMTKEMFDMYFDPDFKPESGHESLLYRENLVNLTLPLFSETYVNQHLDKSLLQRYGVKKLQTRSAELWSMSATPTAHLSAMLQRTHFELVIEDPDVLSKHKKRARRSKKRNRRKSKRTATSIIVNKYNEDDEKVRLTQNEDGTEVLELMQQGNGL